MITKQFKRPRVIVCNLCEAHLEPVTHVWEDRLKYQVSWGGDDNDIVVDAAGKPVLSQWDKAANEISTCEQVDGRRKRTCEKRQRLKRPTSVGQVSVPSPLGESTPRG